jgi:hypothetical protein
MLKEQGKNEIMGVLGLPIEIIPSAISATVHA